MSNLKRTLANVWVDARWFIARLSHHTSADNCALIAGALSFFSLISIFPMVILAVSLLGRLLGSSAVAEEEVEKFLEMLFPQTSQSLMVQIRYIAHHTRHDITEVLSMTALLWAGTHVFDYLERALNHTWGVARTRGFLKRKLTAVLGFLIAGAMFLLSLGSSAMFAALSRMEIDWHVLNPQGLAWLLPGLSLISAWVMAVLMFFLIYWLLPNMPVPLTLAFNCALLATVLWELTKWGFSKVMARTDTYGWIYGPLAGTVVTMVWLYLSSLIMLLGAEIGRTYQELAEEKGRQSGNSEIDTRYPVKGVSARE